MLGATLGKIANRFTCSSITIDELAEPFSEASSVLRPCRTSAIRARGSGHGVSRAIMHNVALMLESMVIEHERDGAAWRAEWRALPESLPDGGRHACVDEICAVRTCGHTDKMRSNPDLLGGFLLSERVMSAVGQDRQTDRARARLRFRCTASRRA